MSKVPGSTALLLSLLVLATPLRAAPPVSFERQIQPILQRHCVECHSGWFPASGLRLDTRARVLEGGKQGRAVIPGEPDKGWLVNMIQPVAGNPSRMPPGPSQLSGDEIALIKQWIREGAR
jgi:uncharacterized membrane protein